MSFVIQNNTQSVVKFQDDYGSYDYVQPNGTFTAATISTSLGIEIVAGRASILSFNQTDANAIGDMSEYALAITNWQQPQIAVAVAGAALLTAAQINMLQFGIGDPPPRNFGFTSAASVTVGTATTVPILPVGMNGQVLQLTNLNTSAYNITLTDRGTMANSNLALVATTQVLAPRGTIELMYSTVAGLWIQTKTLCQAL